METTIPRRRRARVLSVGAAIALVALLLPATAGIALGHVASATCDQITNDPLPEWGVFTGQVYPTGSTTSVGTLPADTIVNGVVTALGALTVVPGSYYVVWSDGFTQGLPGVPTNLEDDPNPIVVGQCTPRISTVASPTTGTVGVPGLVGDTATLSTPVTFITGTLVTFTLYSDNECSVSTGVTGTGSLSESGVATFSQSWTPSAAGTYYWRASFPGDTYNNAVAACGGETETVVVSQPTSTPTPTPTPTPPTSPPCTAANGCFFNTPTPPVNTPTPPVNTPTPPVNTPTPPVVTPTPSQSVEPTASPSPTPTGNVEAATSKPHVTPPPTSALGGSTGGPSSGIALVLLALAALVTSLFFLTQTSLARVRRR